MKEKMLRYKIMEITPEAIFNVLFYWHKSKNITLPYAINLPDDVKILGIHYSFERNIFLIKIESKEFDEVELFCEPERLSVFFINAPLPKKTQAKLIEEARKIDDYYNEDEKGRLTDG